MWYIQSFVVGYDDLTFDQNPNIIFRYGRSWHLQCRIRASNTLFVEPGLHVNQTNAIETDTDFSLNVFNNPEYTQPYTEAITVGTENLQKQTVYVQAESSIASDSGFMLHLKECKDTVFKELNVWGQQFFTPKFVYAQIGLRQFPNLRRMGFNPGQGLGIIFCVPFLTKVCAEWRRSP